jgi:hypothetical protein
MRAVPHMPRIICGCHRQHNPLKVGPEVHVSCICFRICNAQFAHLASSTSNPASIRSVMAKKIKRSASSRPGANHRRRWPHKATKHCALSRSHPFPTSANTKRCQRKQQIWLHKNVVPTGTKMYELRIANRLVQITPVPAHRGEMGAAADP